MRWCNRSRSYRSHPWLSIMHSSPPARADRTGAARVSTARAPISPLLAFGTCAERKIDQRIGGTFATVCPGTGRGVRGASTTSDAPPGNLSINLSVSVSISISNEPCSPQKRKSSSNPCPGGTPQLPERTPVAPLVKRSQCGVVGLLKVCARRRPRRRPGAILPAGDRRRAGLGHRCVATGTNPESAAGPAGRVQAHLPVRGA